MPKAAIATTDDDVVVQSLPGLFNTYLLKPALVDALPPLVRKQRKAEARLVPFEVLAEQEKAIRFEIDALLQQAGFDSNGQFVTCLGYDVVHNERKGHTSTDLKALEELLVFGGVKRELVQQALAQATTTGEPSKFALVKPCKGSTVRNPR